MFSKLKHTLHIGLPDILALQRDKTHKSSKPGVAGLEKFGWLAYWFEITLWCLGGYGRMHRYSSPLYIYTP